MKTHVLNKRYIFYELMMMNWTICFTLCHEKETSQGQTLGKHVTRGRIRGGVTGARPLNQAQLTDQLLFSPHLAKVK